MHKPSAMLVVALLTISLSAISSHAQGKVEVFAGYSYLRPELTQVETSQCMLPVCPLLVSVLPVTTRPNLNGWAFSATYLPIRWLGARADFSGSYGAALGSTTANVHTFLFGPEARWPGHVSPFAHVLLGGARAGSSAGTISNPTYSTIGSGSDVAFASAIGGGIDVWVRSRLWIRLIQVDDLVTRFYSGTENQPRISAGVVVHF